MPPVAAPEAHLRLIAWFTEGATGAEIEAFVRTYKKSTAVRSGEPKQLLDTLRQFATLNSARIDLKRRELLFADTGLLFKEMSKDTTLGFSYEEIGGIAGKDKSTVSRQISKSLDDVATSMEPSLSGERRLLRERRHDLLCQKFV